MSLTPQNKVTYVDGQTVITAANLNNIQDTVLDNAANKEDKVVGKGLSTNDFTDAEKEKLDENAVLVNLDNATLISANADLFELSAGQYYSNSSDRTGTLTNVPSGVTGAFRLYVMYNSASSRKFMLLISVGQRMYFTTESSNGWYSWAEVFRDKDVAGIIDSTLSISGMAADAKVAGDAIADATSNINALSDCLRGVSDRTNFLHNLINYGYENADLIASDSGVVTKIGVSRRNTQVTLNAPSVSTIFRVKVSGTLERAETQNNVDAWQSSLELIEGHKYRATMVYESGTVTGDNAPTLGIYEVGSHSSIGVAENNGSVKSRVFTAGSTRVNLAIYVYAYTALTNAVYNIFLEDITDGIDIETIESNLTAYNATDILPYGNFKTKTSNGITYTFQPDGSCTISGTATDSSFANIISNTSSVPAYVEKGRTYFIDFNGGNIPIRIYYFYEDSTRNKDITYRSSFALKIPEDLLGITIRFQIASGTSFETPVTVKYKILSYQKPTLIHDVNLAMLGDSITTGRIGNEDTSHRPEENIPQRVANELQINTTNLGRGSMGWISHEHLDTNAYEYIQTLDLSGYNYISLAYGANDSAAYLGTYEDTTEETIMGNVYKTCYYLMQNYPTIQIILITPALGKSGGSFPGWGWAVNRGPNDGHWTFADLVEEFEKFSEKYHVPLIRADKAFTSFNLNAMIGDNVHPTREGYKILGHYIAGQLRKFL